MTLCDSSSKSHQGRNKKGGDGGKIEWKLSEVNAWALFRGQNELIGMFKMAAGDVISSGVVYELHVHSKWS